MNKVFIIAILMIVTCNNIFGQHFLPEITAKNINNRIIISWFNNYKKNISDILIQRSFDSLNNFTTIGSVINPQSIENGFPDDFPPYNKMYYRVTLLFEGGSYEIGPSIKPIKEPMILKELDVTYIPEEPTNKDFVNQEIEIYTPAIPKTNIDSSISLPKTKPIFTISNVRFQKPKIKTDSIKKTTIITPTIKIEKQIQVATKKSIQPKENSQKIAIKEKKKVDIVKPAIVKDIKIDSVAVIPEKKKIESAFPSNSVFINKSNTLTINIKDSAYLSYQIKFYNDNNKLLFELSKIKSKCFFIDKLNFPHAGWYYFEIYKNGELIEKSKFNILKDRPKN